MSKLTMTVCSLPASFDNFRCAIESRDELPTPEVLRIKILDEADARKNDTRNTLPNAMMAKRYQAKRHNKQNTGNGN